MAITKRFASEEYVDESISENIPKAEAVADIVMANYVTLLDEINGEPVYDTDTLSTDLDEINGEVI